MPSAEQLTLYQAQRRAMVVAALAEAGWQSDSALWDAGVDTDFVATMTSRRAGGLLRCDYVIAAGDANPREYLSLRSGLAGEPVHLVVDFLGQTGRGADRLADVLAVLVAAQAGRAEDPFGADALARICPVFAVGEHGGLMPVPVPGPVPGDGPDVEVTYADEVEERLHRELVPAGWRRSPDEAILLGLRETFYVDVGDNGTVCLSAGRCNGEETLVRVTTGETSVHLRVDGVHRPEHADRLVGLLRGWQDRISAENWRQFVAELSASYARVHVEDEHGHWNRVSPATRTRPAAGPPGTDQRAGLVESLFVQAGWTPVAGPGRTPVSVCVRNPLGVTLRVDHVPHGFDGIGEALALAVRLAEGSGGPYDGAVTLALDVFDLHSGRGGRDRFRMAIEIILARYADLDSQTLPTTVQALRLCCPVLLVDADGSLRPLPASTAPTAGPELALPPPRPVDEVDRLLSTGAGDPAELWFERGLAALAEDRPDLALDSFDESVRADPRFGPAHLQRALLIGATDVAETARGLLCCAELGYAPELVLTRYGRLLFGDGHWMDGLTVFRHLAENLPGYGSGWYERALAALQEGLYDEAVAAATAATALAPDSASAFYLRARGHARGGQADRALADIARALELDGSLRWAIATDQDLYSLRGDDRFVALLA
ncbi:MAG TPA: hypothetical protein VFX70_15980, partial [Mycobacteriales bacterium]|nr:hypothetical protein [Mycobacteriales bacterium]